MEEIILKFYFVGNEGARNTGDGARHRDHREHMLHIQHVLVIQRQHDEHGEHGAEREQKKLGNHHEEFGHERAQVEQRGLVGSREARLQLVVKLVEVAEIELAVVAPSPHAQ